MEESTSAGSAQPRRSRGSQRVAVALALSLAAVLALGGCISVNSQATPTPTPAVTPVGPTPPPTAEPATPEPDATLEPDTTPRTTRRPQKTPKPTAPPTATPRPTRRPTPSPTATTEPTTVPVVTPEPSGTANNATPVPAGWPAGAHGSNDAPNHVGETGTVCGTVVAAQYLPDAPGRPTFLNIDHPYPNQTFNVVIWGEQRRAFPLNKKPEINLLGKVLCTTGEITGYVNWTQIAYASRQATDVVP